MTASSRTRRATFSNSSECCTLSKLAVRSKSMMRVFSSTIAWATRATASCAVRFGRYPYDPAWKSASKIGSRMSFNAPWTTRSRIAGIERTRTFLPPSFGISFFRALMGRYVLVTSSSRICPRKLSAPLSSMAWNVTPSIPGAPPLLLAIW